MAFSCSYNGHIEGHSEGGLRRSWDGSLHQDSCSCQLEMYREYLRRQSSPDVKPSAPSYEELCHEEDGTRLELEYLDHHLRPPFISRSNPTTPGQYRAGGSRFEGQTAFSDSPLASRDAYYSTFANVPEIQTYLDYMQDDSGAAPPRPRLRSNSLHSRRRSHQHQREPSPLIFNNYNSGGAVNHSQQYGNYLSVGDNGGGRVGSPEFDQVATFLDIPVPQQAKDEDDGLPSYEECINSLANVRI